MLPRKFNEPCRVWNDRLISQEVRIVGNTEIKRFLRKWPILDGLQGRMVKFLFIDEHHHVSAWVHALQVTIVTVVDTV